MSAQFHTTGSGELSPIIFVDGVEAKAIYGVEIRSGGPCPTCKAPIHITLSFNPCDSNYYLHCPVCGRWYRWTDLNGNLIKHTKVTSRKRTKLDIDLDEGYWWTF